jgi:hypothetical protein
MFLIFFLLSFLYLLLKTSFNQVITIITFSHGSDFMPLDFPTFQQTTPTTSTSFGHGYGLNHFADHDHRGQRNRTGARSIAY